MYLLGSPASLAQSPVTPKVLRYRDAATYLGISHGRLRNLVSEGRGPASVTYGKRDRAFPIAALDAFIDQRTTGYQPATPEPVTVKRRPGRPRKTEQRSQKQMAHWTAVMMALFMTYLLWAYGFLGLATGFMTN